MALIVTLLLGTMFAALSSALTIAITTETIIAAAHREATALLYAAEAGSEFAVRELSTASWDDGLQTTTPIVAADVATITGYASIIPTRVEVWLRDVTEELGEAGGNVRAAEITSTARGAGGAQRTVTLVVRLTWDGENMRIDRLSWTS